VERAARKNLGLWQIEGGFKLVGMCYVKCISSLGWPEASLEGLFELAARYDVPRVELRSLGGTIDLRAYLEATYGTPAELVARGPSVAGRVVALNASLALAGATIAAREELVGLAPWADALGARWLRVFDGGRPGEVTAVAVVAAETVRWWREMRRERGWRVELMVETHDSLLSAAAITEFLAAVPGVGLLWDAHHTWRKGGEDPVATWRAVRAHVVHLHVKDSVAVPSARHPFTYVLPGDGGFPMAALMAAVRVAGFTGPVSLEWEKQWHPYLPPLETALRVAAVRTWW